MGDKLVHRILLGGVVCLAAVAVLVWCDKKRQQQSQAAQRKLVADRIAEMNVAASKVAQRQSKADVTNAVTVNLIPYTNSALADSFVPKKVKDNNLAQLPRGTNIFAGIPFNVQGRIQLWGTKLPKNERGLPVELKGINVKQQCSKIHILHGALFAQDAGSAIAKLVLHYQNGTEEVVKIIVGEHVQDWWGPLYKTGNGTETDDGKVSAPNSELAWAGKNPYILTRKASWFVRLYKSTFQNPKLTEEISSIDFVCLNNKSGPFLVGLTLE